ncbi:MAG TPA: hypothetical protein VJH70_02700 [Candidatus Paceibacterota bacterium]
MDPLLKFLQQLKELKPDEHYHKISLPVIISAPQKRHVPFLNKFLEVFHYSSAVVLASLLLFVMLGGLSLLNRPGLTTSALAGLDSNNLNAELAQFNLQIQLSEAQYFANSSRSISSTPNEILNDIPSDLNTAIIEKELNGVEQASSSAKNLNDLLDILSE